MSNSDIRLFNNTALLRHGRQSNNAHGWQRVVLAEAGELLPVHPVTLRATVEPFAPHVLDSEPEGFHRPQISRDRIIHEIPSQLGR
jgi:hypothetical protein